MRAVDHWLEAERLLGEVTDADSDADPAAIALLVQFTQAHATLALAGATALQSYARVGDDDGELDDWKTAAGGES
jgi:hypothetical protein